MCDLDYFGLGYYAARQVGKPPAWVAAGAAIVILPVFTGAFDSLGRFGLLAPPLFWGLAGLTTSARSERVVRSLLLILLVVGTASLAYVFP